ncbi:YfcC family protein [Sporosarcina pasteurii]|uniref:p-aminobenzoyl-glutamate transporter n=1 Tax=Sporosarcina pasteurii TaxID=1474 RepID=A0A380BD23_SPOPA|nr:AbgT family transporter [Sporosarcina pasteurii]MDS9472556.1 AbgT family transporter [Sporosarcina pasteurii]QBQ06109.1 YfcC family protein [Sporosarcina pasteurii]SUI99414.1 Putative p-aminobenzoyl-glutamate transporter [Sporosarcina pasteurii]
MNTTTKKKFKFSMPDAFIIIFSIVALASIATYIIPSGAYDRETIDGVTRVVPDSYAKTEANPTNLLDLFTSIQIGMVQSANIIFLIFIIGGIVRVIESTGAIDSGINSLIQKTKGRYMLLITSVAGIFGLLASMGLAANAVIAFIPIGIALARSLKLDAIVGISTIYLGYYAGMIAGIFDPTILGLAQTIAELPLFSGMPLRIVIFIALITITITYTNLYAKKIKHNPERSIMGNKPFGDHEEVEVSTQENVQNTTFSAVQKSVLLTFIGAIGIFIFGAFTRGWGLNELVGIFLIMGVVIAIIARITPNNFVKTFIEGAQAITYGALVVGLARAVIVVLEDGKIIDTIVNAALGPLQSMPVLLGGQLLFIFNLLFNLLVTSGTGQAAIVMPIMVPLVDMLGITRQTGTLAFMLGDGITNIITPTSGVLMAVLAVGGVKWTQWVRFAFPIMLMWVIVGIISITYAIYTGYGPF